MDSEDQGLSQIDTEVFGRRLKEELSKLGETLLETNPDASNLQTSGTILLRFSNDGSTNLKARVCCICFMSSEGVALCMGDCC